MEVQGTYLKILLGLLLLDSTSDDTLVVTERAELLWLVHIRLQIPTALNIPLPRPPAHPAQCQRQPNTQYPPLTPPASRHSLSM